MANLIDTCIEHGQLTTLVTMLRTTGLLDTLANEGPFTIFAPSDEAWSNVEPHLMESLLGDIPRLREVLKYHVVSGKLSSDDLRDQDLHSLQSLQGDNLDLNPTVLTVNGVDISEPDLEADNGIIHVIDRVLQPAFMRERQPAMAQV